MRIEGNPQRRIAKALINLGRSTEDIVQLSGLSEEEVEAIKEEMRGNEDNDRQSGI